MIPTIQATTRRRHRTTLRRRVTALLFSVALAAAVGVLTAPAASADPLLPVTWNVDARTHLAKSGFDVTVPRGSFSGTIDVGTGAITGDMNLPPARITMNLAGAIPVADASFVMSPVGHVTGHVDLATFDVTTTATFDIRLAKVTPHGVDMNLVGDQCKTSKPITVSMGGTVDLAKGSTFTGTYAIPKFEHCRALTPALNAMIPGDGNTFTASFSPPGTPPPATAPAAPTPAPAGGSARVDAAAGPVHLRGNGAVRLLTPPLLIATPAADPAPAPPPGPTPAPNPAGGLVGSLLGLLGS